MRKEIIDKLLRITDTERSVMAENYNLISDAEPAFAGMKLRRRDYLWNVIDSERTVTVRPHTRFVDIPLHSHNYVEMMYVCHGSVTHVIDGQNYVLNEGELLIMNRHIMHSIPASKSEDAAVNFIISPDLLSSSHRLRDNRMLQDLVLADKEEKASPRFLIYSSAKYTVIQNLLENLISDTVFDSASQSVIYNSIIKDTLFLLFKYFELYPDTLLHSSSGQTDEAPIKSKIGAYVQNNFKGASLSELSEMLGMSQPYVSKKVKELFSVSFTDLVKERRFSEAEQLLLNSDIPISDIAEAVGYENNSFFHRLFREQYGTSPAKWRKERKGKTSL